MSNLALFQISEQYRNAAEEMANLDLPAEAVADTLEGLTGDLETKATNVALFARNLESLAEQIKEAEATMAHRRKIIENRADAVREYIRQCMETAGISKISCPYFELAVVKNPPSLEMDNGVTVPEVFMRQPEPPSPDKKAILEYLKAGKTIDGCRLVQKNRLRIK